MFKKFHLMVKEKVWDIKAHTLFKICGWALVLIKAQRNSDERDAQRRQESKQGPSAR